MYIMLLRIFVPVTKVSTKVMFDVSVIVTEYI